MGNFWIGSIPLREIGNGCRTCRYRLNQHIQIDYVLEDEYLNNSSKYDRNQIMMMPNQLCHGSAGFYDFLTHIARSSKDDPFFISLVTIITEENYLSENLKPNDLNLQSVNG